MAPSLSRHDPCFARWLIAPELSHDLAGASGNCRRAHLRSIKVEFVRHQAVSGFRGNGIFPPSIIRVRLAKPRVTNFERGQSAIDGIVGQSRYL
jgi:hypothetical protein